MLLQDPPESNYDLRFELFGFPIRVAWTFWLGALVFGYSLVNAVDRWLSMTATMDSPGRFPLLLLWGGCLLLSILIHELGHAFAFQQFGIRASVVLYHFGGLAIPKNSYSSARGFAPAEMSAGKELWIAAAGPLAQLLSAVVVIAAYKAAGYSVAVLQLIPGGDRIPGLAEGEPINNAGLFALLVFYSFPSVLWALLNLIPVWPLDGGRIMRSVVLLSGGRIEQSLWISLIAGGAMAFYGFTRGNIFLGILFLSLAISNYQMLQMQGRWRY